MGQGFYQETFPTETDAQGGSGSAGPGKRISLLPMTTAIPETRIPGLFPRAVQGDFSNLQPCQAFCRSEKGIIIQHCSNCL
jgi:hypothetical protein